MNIVHIGNSHWDSISSGIEALSLKVFDAKYHPEYKLIRRIMDGIVRAHALAPRYDAVGNAIQYLRFRQSWLVMMATETEELHHVWGDTQAEIMAQHLRAVATDPKCWAQPLEVA